MGLKLGLAISILVMPIPIKSELITQESNVWPTSSRKEGKAVKIKAIPPTKLFTAASKGFAKNREAPSHQVSCWAPWLEDCPVGEDGVNEGTVDGGVPGVVGAVGEFGFREGGVIGMVNPESATAETLR